MKHKQVAISVLLLMGLAVGCSNQPKNDVASTESIPAKTTNAGAASKPASKTAESVSQVKSNSVHFYTDNGVAIRGTDPVAYFQEGKPVQGNSQFAYKWMNATWYFSSAANRDLFVKNPQKYAPQYGGFCAWAVSRGYTASTDPDVWKIVDGKLYLNYNKGVQRSWEQNIPDNISSGDRNWPSLNDKLKN